MSHPDVIETMDLIRKAKPGEMVRIKSKDVFDYITAHVLHAPFGVSIKTEDKASVIHPVQSSGNPKDLVGSTKVPLNLVPAAFLAETSLAFLEGKLKYGEVNWRAAPVRASIYLDALLRHICKYAEGEDRDTKSRVHHLGNAGACLGIIIDAALAGTLIDDRKMSNPKAIEQMDELSETVKHLKELFKDSKPKHFTKENSNEVRLNQTHPHPDITDTSRY